MLKWKTLTAMALAGGVVTLAAAQAKQGAKPATVMTLTAMDYIEIQQLVARYPFAVNTGDNNGYAMADLFVPDGIFRGRLVPFSQGREQLAALARGRLNGPFFVRHFATNHVIEPSPEGATGKQYLVVLDIGENGQPSSVNQGGHFDDEYVKTPQGWRFKSRTYVPSEAGAVVGQSHDPWFGTWKLNFARSTYAPDAPPRPRSTITRVEPWEGGLKYVTDTVTAQGQTRHVEWSAKFDGKDYAVKDVPAVDTYAIKRIDDHTYEVIAKKGGKVTTTSRSVISADGKSRTVTQLGQHADGDKVDNTLIFDKQ